MNAILEQLLDLLFTIARADGDITNPEWDYLRQVADVFGYDEYETTVFILRQVCSFWQ